MKLLQEFSRGDTQADLKSSDQTDAGRNDMAAKPVDIRFSLMRNMINKDGGVTGSDVNDYLERAHDLNNEVDTVGFAVETDEGDFIKIYVNATQADEFEQELSKILGLDDDSEAAINQLAQKFDIVDVVWPTDAEGNPEDGHAKSGDDVNIDDDLSSFLNDTEADQTAAPEEEPETDPDAIGDSEDDELSVLPADDEGDTDDASDAKPPKKTKSSLMKDVDAEASDEDAPPEDDAAGTSGTEDETPPSEDDDAASGGSGPEEIDTDSDAGGSAPEDEEETDEDGKPKKKKKADKPEDKKTDSEKEVTEEGLKVSRLAALAENIRDEVHAHVSNVAARGNSGRYVIDCLMTGGTLGRREYQYQEEGTVKYFDTIEEADKFASELHARRNHTLARASYTFTPRLIEQADTQEDNMSIGSKFLERLNEADAEEVSVDTAWKGVRNQLKRPYEKKIVELFSMLGVPGRYAIREEGLIEAIRGAADVIRRPGRKQSSFNNFYDALKASATVAEKKRGGRLQKVLETVMVSLGFPESLVTTEGGSPLGTTLARAANKIEASNTLEPSLIALAKALGISSAQINEGKEFKVKEPGWYVVDHMDKPVDGPYSEGNAKREAEEMSDEHEAKHGKGDIPAFDALYFSDYDIKRMNEGSVLGGKYESWEKKPMKVREPGWYVVDHMDKPVDGPFSRGGAKTEADERNEAHAAKNGKGDITPFDILEFDADDIKKLREETEASSVGSRFLSRVSEAKKTPGPRFPRSPVSAFFKAPDDGVDTIEEREADGVEYIHVAVSYDDWATSKKYYITVDSNDKVKKSSEAEFNKIPAKKKTRMKSRVSEDVDVGQDDFMQQVVALAIALGIPERNLQYNRANLIKSLREKKMSLGARSMIEQRMAVLMQLIQKNTRQTPNTTASQEANESVRISPAFQNLLNEGLMMEAFNALEAIVGKELEHHNAEEPANGPALAATYDGVGGAHEDTMLFVAVDPDADDHRNLRVGIDSPWDGVVHSKYFPNTKEGYKAAVEYANMLRTVTFKKGGRPKGWKEAPTAVSVTRIDPSEQE
jgi:hypothetical protein